MHQEEAAKGAHKLTISAVKRGDLRDTIQSKRKHAHAIGAIRVFKHLGRIQVQKGGPAEAVCALEQEYAGDSSVDNRLVRRCGAISDSQSSAQKPIRERQSIPFVNAPIMKMKMISRPVLRTPMGLRAQASTAHVPKREQMRQNMLRMMFWLQGSVR